MEHSLITRSSKETKKPVSDLQVILENAGREVNASERSLIDRLLNDFEPPRHVDLIHIFGRAKGDEVGPMSRAGELYRQGYTNTILIPGHKGETWAGSLSDSLNVYFQGSDEESAGTGRRLWKKMLIEKYGIRAPDIHYSNPPFNTKLDAEALLRFARSHDLKNLAIVTQPHQIERAFLSMVATMRDRKTWFNVYTIVPKTTDWDEVVPGSQGQNPKPRYQDVAPEMKRVLNYAPKDIATYIEGLVYLRQRDRGEFKR